jgi:hypothetical protein
MLANRRWLCRTDPFPHVTAANVFVPSVSEALSAAARRIRERGLDGSGRYSYMGWYDAHGLSFDAAEPWPLGLFVSKQWHDLIAGVARVEATGHVNAGLHYHAPGSSHGFVHNDLNPAWFARTPEYDEVELARHDVVKYTTGESPRPGVRPIRVVRAAALLYFLDNDGWRPGDGGELGLYRSISDEPGRPAHVIAPRTNSLVLFECTPYSYHCFISNSRVGRTSVIMWLHRSERDAIRRWGEGALVPFARRAG